jgi:hypothetical protein
VSYFHRALPIGIILENYFLFLIELKAAFSKGFFIFYLPKKELMGGKRYKSRSLYLIIFPVGYGV